MNDFVGLAGLSEAPARFTVDQFMEIVNASVFLGNGKTELVDGVIVHMSPAQNPHMRYQRQVFVALHEIFGSGLEGFIAQFELTILLREATLRVADIGVIEADGLQRDGFADPRNVRLAVEIADSSLDKDLSAKRADYARAAVPHYWVVDINGGRVFTMTTPVGGDYADRTLYDFGREIPVPGTGKSITIA